MREYISTLKITNFKGFISGRQQLIFFLNTNLQMIHHFILNREEVDIIQSVSMCYFRFFVSRLETERKVDENEN